MESKNTIIKSKSIKLPKIVDIPLIKRIKPTKDLNIDEEINFTIKSLHSKIKRNKKGQKIPIKLTIKSNEILTDENRAGLDLIIMIDISGSMGGKKLKQVKKTLNFIVNNLTKIDRLGLTTFSDQSNFLSPLTPMTESNRRDYKKIINRLYASGQTDIEGAVKMGLEILENRKEINETTAIFLLGDGKDTEGGSLKSLEKMMKEKDEILRNKKMSYKIHNFGYGINHDEEWLSFISNFKDGKFYYIEKDEMIQECFIDCLGGLLSTIATKSKINLFLDKNCKFVNKYGESWKDKTNKEIGIINVDTIISDMDKDFMAEIEISDIPKDKKKIKIAFAILSYNTDKGKSSKTVNLFLDITEDNDLGDVNREVEKIFLKMETGNKIQQFEKLADLGQLKEADEMMKKFNHKIQNNSRVTNIYKEKLMGITDVAKLRNKKFTKQYSKVCCSDQYAPGYVNFKRQRAKAKKMMKK